MENQTGRDRCHVLVTAAAAIAMLCLYAAGLSDLIGTAFPWHVRQLEFRDGLIELVSVGMLVFIGLVSNIAYLRFLLPAAACFLYLRLHAVDVALIVSAIYVLGIYFFGSVVYGNRAGDEVFRMSALRAVFFKFSLGVSSFAVFLLLPSLALGVPYSAIKALSFIFCIAGFFLAFATRRMPRVSVNVGRIDVIGALCTTMACVIVLAVMARSNVVVFYDSVWYGMRPDRVLFGPTGFYDFLGLTTQVHYYPKLYELLIAPLQGWGDASFAIGFGVASLIAFSAAVFALAREVGVSIPLSSALTVALMALPAAAGSAETTKGDLLASAFVLFAILSLCKSHEENDPTQLADVVVFALLASAARLSVLPWLAILFVLFVVELVRQVCVFRWKIFENVSRRSLIAIALSMAAFLLVHYRTLLLTGTPVVTNASTQDTLSHLGFSIVYPIGDLTGSKPAEGIRAVFSYLHQLAIGPSRFTFHVFKWMGAAWLALPLAGVAAFLFCGGSRFKRYVAGVLCIFGLGLPLLLAYNAWAVKGGDGNYFLIPVVCLVIFGAAFLSQTSRILVASFLLCAVMAFTAYFAGSNWVQGTSSFSSDLLKSPYDEPAQMSKFLELGGLGRLGMLMEHCGSSTRVIGLLPEPYAFALPSRYEPLQELAWNNAGSFESPSAFKKLLHSTGTQLIILPATRNGDGRDDIAAVFANVSGLLNSKDLVEVPVADPSVRAYMVSDRLPSQRCLAGLRGTDS